MKNTHKKRKLIVICGPTATGKTAKSIEIAKKIGGEIISADSRQIYKYMDIGTAKITADKMQNIPHHMIDIAHPNDDFSVAEYKEQAQRMIDEIYGRGNIPILVGGTGMYIDAVIYDREFPNVPPNEKLRDELEQLPITDLQEKLRNIDLNRYKTIDQNNPVRLIRAIEIADSLGSVPQQASLKSKYDLEIYYMDLPDSELQEKIHKRNVSRIENELINEVQNLHDKHDVSWQRLYDLGLEYRYVTLWLLNKKNKCNDTSMQKNERIPKSKENLVEILDHKTWQYVKRQRTWFKKYIKI